MTSGATLSQKPILFMISCLRVIRRFFADAPVARPQTARGSTTSGVPTIGIIAITPPAEVLSPVEFAIIKAVTPMIRRIATQVAIPKKKAAGIFFLLASVPTPP